MKSVVNVTGIVLGLVMVLFSGQAKAEFISPISALMTGHAVELGGMGASNLIGEALNVEYVQVSGIASMWQADTGGTLANPVEVALTFDLGAVYENVNNLYVWRFNWPGNYTVQQRSVAGFDLDGNRLEPGQL